MGTRCFCLIALCLIVMAWPLPAGAAPLGAAITYQGQLKQAGVPYSGTADLRLTLYDALSGGAVLGSPVTVTNVSVVNGLFTVQVDFGAPIPGATFGNDARWMLIEVRTPAGSGSFAALSPRQAVTAVPNAIFASKPWVTSGANVYYPAGNVGIGTAAPAQGKLHVVHSEGAFNGNAIYGVTNGVVGISVYGVCTGAGGRAVGGVATSLSESLSYGGHFENESPVGRGVLGWANSTTGINFGVMGGSNSPVGYAVYAAGNFAASGTKSFRIDHPDDPANKYLLHYSAESPDVINFYSGNVTLDKAGEAVVELPTYFAKINRDPRYTLTAVGAPMPMLHIASKINQNTLAAGARAEPAQAIAACTFRISGGVAGGEVSWRVDAVRNDRWAQRAGSPVEAQKQGIEKDSYQHPELYGQPQERSMYHQPEAKVAAAPAVRQPR